MIRSAEPDRWWRQLVPIVCLGSVLTGCAPAMVAPPTPPTPAEVNALEARLNRDSSNVTTLVSLGQAYQLLERADDVVPLLERALSLRPNDARLVLLLGIAYEDVDRLPEAAALYERYIDISRDPVLRRHLDGRLRVLRQRHLASAAWEAVIREMELGDTEPDPATVAVLPFLIQTQDTTLQPLGRALAEMLITDLSQADRLVLRERMQVQLLVNEMMLTGEGLVDPATAARSGRLLGAGQVVQGGVAGDPEALRLEAAIVTVESGVPEVQAAQMGTPLERLFDAQKALALEIYRVLGIELTPAERERVLRRRTENLRAILAYGLALEAEDGAAFDLASQYFTQAFSYDPDFTEAEVRASAAARAAAAAEISTAALWQRAAGETVDALTATQAMIPAMEGRDAVAELFGQDALIGAGSVIRIHLLGGGGGN